MKQFELHPASESYYRKRVQLIVLDDVGSNTIACSDRRVHLLSFAVSSTTAYAAVAAL